MGLGVRGATYPVERRTALLGLAREILELRWSEVDDPGGVVRLSPERSKTRVGRVLPIVAPIAAVLVRRRAHRQGADPLVFRRDAVTVRAWRTAWPEACRRAGVPGRLLHDCRRTAARNLVRAGVPERVLAASAPRSSRNSEYRRSIATPGNNRASHPDDRATVIIGLAGR